MDVSFCFNLSIYIYLYINIRILIINRFFYHLAMPAKTTLFDHRANAIFSFGVDPRNYVRYNPQGSIVAVAGFGNLNGTIDLWDRKTLKKVNTFHAPNASHCEWSPCGRFLMTATLTPRLRVDNGFKMWHHSGSLIYEENVDELFQVGWRPQPVKEFPSMRSPSPPPKPIKINATSKTATISPRPAGAYRPPHLRGSNTGTTTLSQVLNILGIIYIQWG